MIKLFEGESEGVSQNLGFSIPLELNHLWGDDIFRFVLLWLRKAWPDFVLQFPSPLHLPYPSPPKKGIGKQGSRPKRLWHKVLAMEITKVPAVSEERMIYIRPVFGPLQRSNSIPLYFLWISSLWFTMIFFIRRNFGFCVVKNPYMKREGWGFLGTNCIQR